jgi:hypothetical protein
MDPLGRTLTASNLSLLLVGIGAGAVASILARSSGRGVVSWWMPTCAVAVAMVATKRWDDAAPYRAIDLAGLAVGVWVAVGAALLHRASRPSGTIPMAVVISLGGIWLAVPENGQVLVLLGVLAGLVLSATNGPPRLSPGAVAVLAGSVAWAVAIGFAHTDLRYVGALLCTGLLLWWPITLAGRGSPPASRRQLLVVGATHVCLVVVAARWIGSAGDATWARVAVVVAAGGVASATIRVADRRWRWS